MTSLNTDLGPLTRGKETRSHRVSSGRDKSLTTGRTRQETVAVSGTEDGEESKEGGGDG